MYAVIDIETTGGNYDQEGITEIAIYQYDGYKITDQFCSLINPKKQIQPFVKKLTGINEKMLQNAPIFFEVAKRIIEITENCIIVAHNAAFDYRILKTEFNRLGYEYERKTICTINLSKELLPDQKVFNLGKLASNLGIPFSDRHRAFGDAQVTLKLFELLIEKDIGKKIIREHTKVLKNNKTPKRYLKIIDKLPSKMGLYYILDTNNEIIYIGKSKNIKQSVIQDLTSSNKKSIIIQNEISKVSFSFSGGELTTYLKQQNEIKINRPKLNGSSKYRIFPIGIRIDKTKTYHSIIVEQVKKNFEYFSVYKNKKLAEKTVLILADKFKIQLKNPNGISSHSKKTIQKKDSSRQHNKKIMELCNSFSYPFPDFLLTENGRKQGEFTFILIKNYQFRGYGYFELYHQIKTMSQILSRLVSMEENNDVKKLIYSFLLRKKYLKLINL
ncbi:exonuclease [Bacteroidetes bacterium SCGC AAA795-G10]|nr:exonuclease [Bacteroidetes bacterium SCGC AAA795-G10]